MAVNSTASRENLRSRLTRWGFNLSPLMRSTGGRLTHIAGDGKTIRLKLPLNRHTRNYVGTMRGGHMYSVVDGIYAVMLIQALGKDYIVWDKAATIRFRKPARYTLYAEFTVSDSEVESIRAAVDAHGKVDRDYAIELVCAAGDVHAEIMQTVHVRRKPAKP